ncbi:MAG: chain length determinant protein EpsF [Burkholderiales bacterium]
MTLTQFLLALRARLGILVMIVAATVLAATAGSLLLPKSYDATASLLVDARDEQSLGNAQRMALMPQERLSYLQTQKDILGSRKVALMVVRNLGLAQQASPYLPTESTGGSTAAIEQRLVESLLKRLKVETSQSNVIQATYASADPVFSALVANAFAKAYIDTMLELRVEPAREAASWFDEQLKGLRANLESAQAKLTSLYQQEKIVSTDERTDVETARLAALSEEVVRAQSQTFQWTSRAQQARSFIERSGSADGLPDVMDNAFIQRLKGELLRGESRLQDLATQYGPNHPQYQRQTSENDDLRRKLNAEMRKVVAGIGSSLRQSEQREAALMQAMAAQRTRMLGLKGNRNEFNVLKRDVESAERAYDTAMQRAVTSQVDSRANVTNVSVLNPAIAPGRPSSPKVGLNIALSVVVGVLLGLGMVLLLERADGRVRSFGDLEDAWNVPVLGELKPWKPRNPALGHAGAGHRALPSPG